MVVTGQGALICTNPERRTEFVSVKKAPLTGTAPRCYCGNGLKQAHHTPVLRVLNESGHNEIQRICSLHQCSSSFKTN
jgi:hypothetical protein